MKHIDLFSGIGGFALAASWAWGEDHNVVCFCEMDKFCQKVLNKHWPGTPIVEDVRDVESILAYANAGFSNQQEREIQTGRDSLDRSGSNRPTRTHPTTGTTTNVDLLTGGFPCQGFSVAGKQRGKEDDRYLWPQMLEIIKATRPRWIIGENVAGK